MKSINNFLVLISQMANVKPNVLDNINEDEVVKDIQGLYGVNPKYLNSDDEVAEIRQARLEAQQKEQEMVQQERAVNMIKTGAEADANLRKGQESGQS